MTQDKPQLGKLTKVDLRDIWKNEVGDFTPWLAREENLKLLSDTIGIDLELHAQEQAVGPYSADILCKDTVKGVVPADWRLTFMPCAKSCAMRRGTGGESAGGS